jgi:hypothetical protein
LQGANQVAKCGDVRTSNGPDNNLQRLVLQWVTPKARFWVARCLYPGLRRKKAPRLLGMLKAHKAGGDKSNVSGDTNEQQKGLYPY